MIYVKAAYSIKTQSIGTWRQALEKNSTHYAGSYESRDWKWTGNIAFRCHYKNVLYSHEKECCKQLLILYSLYASCCYVYVYFCVCAVGIHTCICYIYICVFFTYIYKHRTMRVMWKSKNICIWLLLYVVQCNTQFQIFVFCYNCQFSHIWINIVTYSWVW